MLPPSSTKINVNSSSFSLNYPSSFYIRPFNQDQTYLHALALTFTLLAASVICCQTSLSFKTALNVINNFCAKGIRCEPSTLTDIFGSRGKERVTKQSQFIILEPKYNLNANSFHRAGVQLIQQTAST